MLRPPVPYFCEKRIAHDLPGNQPGSTSIRQRGVRQSLRVSRPTRARQNGMKSRPIAMAGSKPFGTTCLVQRSGETPTDQFANGSNFEHASLPHIVFGTHLSTHPRMHPPSCSSCTPYFSFSFLVWLSILASLEKPEQPRHELLVYSTANVLAS